jgi:dinuclear metal center YbgI/SA1388 family protein
MKISKVIEALEQRAPSSFAESWDNVGLLAGDPQWSTSSAVVSIDLTERAIEQAERTGARLIVNHHPCIFGRGLSRITPSSSKGAEDLIFRALQKRIAVYATHTNFDRCALEVPQAIASSLDLQLQGRLHESVRQGEPTPLRKLVVFVPRSHVEAVREALAEAGAGEIGNYDSCAFLSEGEGTFRGNDRTRPFLGKAGKLERAQEVRLETVYPAGRERSLLAALRQAHPYEEVAYDLYPVLQNAGPRGLVSGLGYGFWGDFERAISFADFCHRVTQTFQVQGFWSTEPAPRKIQRVGFAAGKGASLLQAAKAAGCDVFVTGEAGYHGALASKRAGTAVLELGHRESERFFPLVVRSWLKTAGLSKVSIVNVAEQKILTTRGGKSK